MRKIIQIHDDPATGRMVALCDDGTLWQKTIDDRWVYLSTGLIRNGYDIRDLEKAAAEKRHKDREELDRKLQDHKTGLIAIRAHDPRPRFMT